MYKVMFYGLMSLVVMGCGGSSNSNASEGNITVNTPTAITSPKPFDAPLIDSVTMQIYLDAINNARAIEQDCGIEGIKKAVGKLTWNDALYKAAYEHSEDLAQSDTFLHEGSGTNSDWTAQVQNLGKGSSLKDRVENNGYSNWKTIGENISGGNNQDLSQEAIDAWIASDRHCAVLMNPDYKEVGMGHVEKIGSNLTHYWTQNFGAR